MLNIFVVGVRGVESPARLPSSLFNVYRTPHMAAAALGPQTSLSVWVSLPARLVYAIHARTRLTTTG